MDSACPHCARPLPELVSGPAVIHRCSSCGSLLLFSNGKLMRATRPADPTPAAIQAVPLVVPRPNMPTPDDSAPLLTPLRPEAEPPEPPEPMRPPVRRPAAAPVPPSGDMLFPDLADQSGRRTMGGGQVALEMAVEERATPLPAPSVIVTVELPAVEPPPAAPLLDAAPPPAIEPAPAAEAAAPAVEPAPAAEAAAPAVEPAPEPQRRRLGERSASDISVVGELGARPPRRRSSFWLAAAVLLLAGGGLYLARHHFERQSPAAGPPLPAAGAAPEAPPPVADTDDDRLADFHRALGDGDFDRALALRNELGAATPARARADQRWPELQHGYVAAHLARARKQHCADARGEAARILAVDPAQPAALAIARRCTDDHHHSLPRPPRDEPSHPPLAAALDQPGSMLSGAMDDYVHHDFAAAIDKARRVLRKGDDAKAWQILGAASCFTHDGKSAKEAQGHVASGAQKNIDYLCARNGVDLK
jgi:hypothetical protein